MKAEEACGGGGGSCPLLVLLLSLALPLRWTPGPLLVGVMSFTFVGMRRGFGVCVVLLMRRPNLPRSLLAPTRNVVPIEFVIEMHQLIDAPDTQRRVLVCKGCSGVGGLSNRTRFVSLHLNCLNGQRRSGRYIPTKAAIQTCEIAVGQSLKDLSKVARERAMKAMVH